MAIEISNFIPAAARVEASASGAGVKTTFLWQEGLIAPECLHESAGEYVFFLEEDVAAEESAMLITQLPGIHLATLSCTALNDSDGTIFTVQVGGTGEGFDPDSVPFYVEWRRVPGIPASFPVATATFP